MLEQTCRKNSSSSVAVQRWCRSQFFAGWLMSAVCNSRDRALGLSILFHKHAHRNKQSGCSIWWLNRSLPVWENYLLELNESWLLFSTNKKFVNWIKQCLQTVWKTDHVFIGETHERNHQWDLFNIRNDSLDSMGIKWRSNIDVSTCRVSHVTPLQL